jgi:uncharacterized protein (TIGR02246 family)
MTTDDVRALADALDRAWSRLDLEAVAALHHPDGTFEVVGHSPLFHGRDEMRKAFAAMLDQQGEAWIERRGLVVAEDALVVESVMYVDLPDKDWVYARPIVDVCSIRDGLVGAKRSYLAPAVRAQGEVGRAEDGATHPWFS